MDASIVITTYNRQGQLATVLGALRVQTFPPGRFEVIVVDNGSLDGTAKFLGAADGVRTLRIDRSGVGKGRNDGAAIARGEVIVFLDDDCVPPPLWLGEFLATFHRTGADVLAGRTINAIPESLMSECYQRLTDAAERLLNTPDPVYCTTNHLGLRATAFRAVDGFASEFFVGGEDRDLIVRLRSKGFRIAFDEQTVIPHAHEFRFSTFLRHFWRLGQGSYLLYKRSRKLNNVRTSMTAPMVMRTIFSAGGPPWDLRSPALFLLACASQASVALSIVYSWMADRGR